MITRWYVIAGATLVLISACGKQAPAPAATAALDEATAAQVGQQTIALQTVERIAAHRSLSPKQALELALEDALLAEQAKAGLPPYAPASHLERVALARSMMEQIAAEARAKGPPTPEELKQVVDSWWWELDRPELFRATHAVVLPGKKATAEKVERARVLAEEIRAAVAGATTEQEFKKRVEAVERNGLKVKVENTQPVASDGRAVDLKRPPKRGSPASKYDLQFAAAAATLRDIGEISPVVRTPFGFHVLMLTERVPGQRAPQELLDSEVFDQRARKIQDDLIASLRAGSNVVVLDQAPAFTGLIRVAQ
ncbi:MAG TPA: peptidyl-prolyl cis-trans isomerase [Polyangiaceae bacterium]|nr:peptidyl-prolyl cis-trans isomerase [Polyangiaceae bacterium]